MPATDTETKSIRSEARERVFTREEEQIRQERAERDLRAANETARINLLSTLRQAARDALSSREETLPAFLAALETVVELGQLLRDARERYGHALSGAIRLREDLEVTWPKAFAVDPTERELLRQAQTLLKSIGGVV